ncbi:hypothetical protein ACP4OV_024803 [Aristida adscensionis]
MASPARPAAAASISGAFGVPPDARCSFDPPLRREGERLVRTYVGVYGPEESYPRDAVMAAVEECMRRQADALLRSLDGIGGRLSQLELYCYKLERSIGELRSDVMDYHAEAAANFASLDKNLRQVQKAVQIRQDKQDFAETQNELAKLQISHEVPAQKSEAAAFTMVAPRENDHATQVGQHEVAFVPIHQINGMHSSAVHVQGSNGFALQHLVPVSLSMQHDHQQMNQASVYYVQSQDRPKCTESKPLEPVIQVVQPLVQNPEARVAVEVPQKSSQATELYPQHQNHRQQAPSQQVDSHTWHSQQPMVQQQQQQQQYIIQQVSRQMAQQQSSSPHSQNAPQALYPLYSSQKPANANTEPRTMVVQPAYSSPQHKHHEVAPPFYGQGNTILLPVAEHSVQQQQQQPQSLQPHSQGSCPPQPSKPTHCSVASYAVQGSGQAYGATYNNPSNSGAAVVAVLPQPPSTGPMAFHHLGPQVVHSHQFGNMVETSSVVGYPRDQVEVLPMVTAAQPSMVDKLNAGSNVTSPREWTA